MNVRGGSAAARPGPRQRGLIVLLGVMAALGPMTVDMYLPALPEITREFDTTEATIQITLTGSLLGMGAGSLLFGMLSDARGRRIPLIIGLSMHVVFSIASAFAGNVVLLIVFRTLQGVGSAAAPSIAMAIVRDISHGRAASVRYSLIMMVSMSAPIVAPLIGSLILLGTDWHGIFIAQGAMSALLVVLGVLFLPETKPERVPFRASRMFAGAASLFTDRMFVGAALSQLAMMAASFCYISGLSFVAQDWYGVSQQVYGAILAVGAVVMLMMNPLSPLLLRRFMPHKVQIIGLIGALTSSALIMVASGWLGLPGVTAFAWLCIGFQQLVIPNNQAMGLFNHAPRAGLAAALIATSGTIGAALSAPLLGLAGTDNGFSMGFGMFAFYAVSLAASVFIIGFKNDDLTTRPVPIVR
ncbi:multidrug effflux MFS transporter [Microbacterium sp. MPKO10]|uniref:multidrug effflux MFS transporter n=1 Tax=Microbacterium sp. MPKO10 TaxID=2989818 RepID=UPI002235BCB2|nr:multidrug effflux MFS transporter [Microbacterium sp. MPKO10]MCW4459881.1 multidrug effflux MFS transporter [Microbacterium sp. MPKO10]